MAVLQHPEYKKIRRANEKLRQSLASQESEIAKIRLQVLEKEAESKALEERLNIQQVMLDEAIQEVVRAKAKLRSLESKAEAASEMAEAEIAVKALKVTLKDKGEDSEIVKAEQLLKMSVKEFQKENYGGALYLTSQAKGHIKNAEMAKKTVLRRLCKTAPMSVAVAKAVGLDEAADANLSQRLDVEWQAMEQQPIEATATPVVDAIGDQAADPPEIPEGERTVPEEGFGLDIPEGK